MSDQHPYTDDHGAVSSLDTETVDSTTDTVALVGAQAPASVSAEDTMACIDRLIKASWKGEAGIPSIDELPGVLNRSRSWVYNQAARLHLTQRRRSRAFSPEDLRIIKIRLANLQRTSAVRTKTPERLPTSVPSVQTRLTVGQTALLLGVIKPTVERWMREGRLGGSLAQGGSSSGHYIPTTVIRDFVQQHPERVRFAKIKNPAHIVSLLTTGTVSL